MSRSVKISLAMIGVAALVLAGLLVFNDDSNEPQSDTAPTSADTADLLVRDDSPRLSKGGEAVFVEFLDFECEGCLSLYPVIEDLR
ncbi:MAG: disulfide bond formation protein DsbA, partial [Brevibacterium aurantiacum]|nr:disulfide bond formation protein DsbA [Brevibacterium aurantiacum]